MRSLSGSPAVGARGARLTGELQADSRTEGGQGNPRSAAIFECRSKDQGRKLHGEGQKTEPALSFLSQDRFRI